MFSLILLINPEKERHILYPIFYILYPINGKSICTAKHNLMLGDSISS